MTHVNVVVLCRLEVTLEPHVNSVFPTRLELLFTSTPQPCRRKTLTSIGNRRAV